MMVPHTVRAHEGLDVRIRGPLSSIYLVSSDVQVLVRKQGSHISDEFIDELVNLFASGIQGGIADAKFAFHRKRARGTGKLGIADNPTGRVSRHVEFRHYTNATLASVLHDLAHVLLSVVIPVGPHLLQFGKLPAFDAEALVVREMPVKNIELHSGHRIEVALDDVTGNPASRDVYHEPAPEKSWLVMDRDSRNSEPLGVHSHQLHKGSEPTQNANGSCGFDDRLFGVGLEIIGLVCVQRLHVFSGVSALKK